MEIFLFIGNCPSLGCAPARFDHRFQGDTTFHCYGNIYPELIGQGIGAGGRVQDIKARGGIEFSGGESAGAKQTLAVEAVNGAPNAPSSDKNKYTIRVAITHGFSPVFYYIYSWAPDGKPQKVTVDKGAEKGSGGAITTGSQTKTTSTTTETQKTTETTPKPVTPINKGTPIVGIWKFYSRGDVGTANEKKAFYTGRLDIRSNGKGGYTGAIEVSGSSPQTISNVSYQGSILKFTRKISDAVQQYSGRVAKNRFEGTFDHKPLNGGNVHHQAWWAER